MGRRPTPEEIADVLGEKEVRRIRRLSKIGQQALSLNVALGEHEDSELLNVIKDDTRPSVFQQLQRKFLENYIQQVMDMVLTPREKEVVIRRFGLHNCIPQTLQDIAGDLGVSRERVRQIEGRAFRKLRRPSCRRILRSYLS